MRKILGSSVAVLLLFLLVVGCGIIQLEKTADIYGTVNLPPIDTTLEPMFLEDISFWDGVGITTVYLDGEEYTSTTSDGKFCFRDLSLGEHTLKIKDSIYTSEEITINLTEAGISDLHIDAKFDACFIGVQTAGPAAYRAQGFIISSYENVEMSYAGVYIDGETEMVGFGGYDENEDYLGVVFFLDLSVIDFVLGDTYTLIIDIYNEDDELIDTVTKDIRLPENIILKDVEINNGIPTFRWDGVEDREEINVSYELILKKGSYGDSIFLKDQTSYTMDSPLSNGNYSWQIACSVHDLSGHLVMVIETEWEDFTVNEPLI